MINGNRNVLKGQKTIARGNAPGLRGKNKIVREMMIIKEKSFFRTKRMTRLSLGIGSDNSVRKDFGYFIQRIFADGSHPVSLTQGVTR